MTFQFTNDWFEDQQLVWFPAAAFLSGPIRAGMYCNVTGMAPDRHIFTMGQAHFIVKIPVRKEGSISAQLSILYSASIVKRVNTILYSLNYII
jgi:hypothetical protein